MSEQVVIIGSLAMDLKRVALGLNRGSLKVAEKFQQESDKRLVELKRIQVNAGTKKIIKLCELVGNETDLAKKSENLLMISILFQNQIMKY